MALFRRIVNQLIVCFSPCFGRRKAQEPPEFEAEETPEKALDFSACEPSCSSLPVEVRLSPHLSSSLSSVSVSSSSKLTASPDLQMGDVEEEEDMEKSSGKSSDLQVVSPSDLEITDIEEMDCVEEMEKMENNIQTPHTLRFTLSGPLEPKRVAWVEDSEEEEEEEVWETEVMEFEAWEEDETGDADTSKKKKQQPQRRRKVSLVMFTWAEQKAMERVERKMKKKQQKRERHLLFQRYRKDPKLRHLKMNINNPNYGS